MRPPFARPFFTWCFYGFAGLFAVLSSLMFLALVVGSYGLLGQRMGLLLAGYGLVLVGVAVVQSLCFAAAGYVIEKVAKIEWNTRPDLSARQAYGGASGASASGAKQYFYIDKGPIRGPLTAVDLLDLYRDGKLSIATRLFVEENGQRRPLANMSEIAQ